MSPAPFDQDADPPHFRLAPLLTSAEADRYFKAWEEVVSSDSDFGRLARCAVCGGLNPGDRTHTRCLTSGYEG